MKTKLTHVSVKENYMLFLRFSDGVEGCLDFSQYVGKGVFSKWNDYTYFLKAHVGNWGQLEWDDDIDFCPDSLHLKITGKSPEQLFKDPSLLHA